MARIDRTGRYASATLSGLARSVVRGLGGSRIAVAVLGAVVGVLVIGAIAIAGIPDANGVIHGCRNTSTGALRVIDNSKTSCHRGEASISWNKKGKRGPAGAVGLTGPRGPRGATGAAGTEGPEGPQGPVGVQGIPGPQGLVGPTGATGPQGPIGPIGPKGPAGPQGVVGPQGPKGATGATGPQGPAGPAAPTDHQLLTFSVASGASHTFTLPKQQAPIRIDVSYSVLNGGTTTPSEIMSALVNQDPSSGHMTWIGTNSNATMQASTSASTVTIATIYNGSTSSIASRLQVNSLGGSSLRVTQDAPVTGHYIVSIWY